MEVPVQPLLLCLPAAIYYLRQRKNIGSSEALSRLGFKAAPLKYYGWGVLAGGAAVALGYVLLKQSGLAPSKMAHTNFAVYSLWTFSISNVLLAALRETIYTTMGEEILFRGLLAGWLLRKFSFLKGNLIQTAAFLLPHLALLGVSIKLWPMMILIAGIGWLLGGLRYKSGSIFPGILAHTVANTCAAIWAMQG